MYKEELSIIAQAILKWEKVHLEQFTNQYNLLKEDWWAEQGFAPF